MYKFIKKFSFQIQMNRIVRIVIPAALKVRDAVLLDLSAKKVC